MASTSSSSPSDPATAVCPMVLMVIPKWIIIEQALGFQTPLLFLSLPKVDDWYIKLQRINIISGYSYGISDAWNPLLVDSAQVGAWGKWGIGGATTIVTDHVGSGAYQRCRRWEEADGFTVYRHIQSTEWLRHNDVDFRLCHFKNKIKIWHRWKLLAVIIAKAWSWGNFPIPVHLRDLHFSIWFMI